MSVKTIEFIAQGMHCAACENYLESRLKKHSGVKKVIANLSQNKVLVQIDSKESKEDLAQDFTDLVKENGYKIILEKEKKDWVKEGKELLYSGLIALFIVMIYLILDRVGFIPKAGTGFSLSPITAFALGIVASLSTCSAVLGGIILALSANTSKSSKKLAFASGVSFHLSRVMSFAILGGVLGLLGRLISQSGGFNQIDFNFWSNLFLSGVMIILGFNLLNIFNSSSFKFSMPKFLGSKISEQSDKSLGIIGGIGLGFLSFFLPCNFTQAIQLSAFNTGSIIDGALLLFAFALGTLPVLALLTFASINFAKSFKSGIFYKTSGFLILAIATYTIYSLLYLRGII